MKNYFNKQKNAGFTLLELVVVVAVMGLISTMAMDVYTDQSNQKRFEATKERLAEIKFAIIGDPMMRVGSQAVLTGFYDDMAELPNDIDGLISDPKNKGECDNSGVITLTDETSCISPATWTSYWRGPYLHNLQSKNGSLVFNDAWGNAFDWDYSSSPGNLIVTSAGLNRDINPSDEGYEEDKFTTIYATELANIVYLNSLTTGYCVIPSTNKIDISITSQTTCISPNVWGSWP